MESCPVAVGVMVMEHVESGFGSLLLWDSVHVPPGANVTVPVGMLAVPAAPSATVAVHAVAWLTATLGGVQATVTVGIRRLVARAVTPELVECVWSPLYKVETSIVPDATGTMLIEQVAEEELTPASVQTPPGVNDIVPVGVVGAAIVSVTVAVHVLSWSMVTGFGVHDTVVVVVSSGTVSTLTGKVPVLVSWLASPL